MICRSWTCRVALLAPAFVVAALMGCSDLMGTEQVVVEDPLRGAEAGIHPVLIVAAESGDEATVELLLKRVDMQSTVASYQGELEYETGALTLVNATIPAGITGTWNEVEKGRVRFAGVALAGIGEGAVLTLRFAARSTVDAGVFRLSIEEITATENFLDLTDTVHQAERPLFSRSPLP